MQIESKHIVTVTIGSLMSVSIERAATRLNNSSQGIILSDRILQKARRYLAK